MKGIDIKRPRLEEKEELHQFFKIVVTDTYAREGLAYMTDAIDNEIEEKRKFLESDYNSNGENRYFLIAAHKEMIVGTIEYALTGELIDRCTNGAFKGLVEIGTVFVHPDYQGQGVGNLLLNAMYNTLQDRGIKEFCLDSGYTNAQKIWKKKFGEPVYLIKDFWGEGYDHMVWRVKIADMIE